ncbi:MAG: hypothetical protein OSA99_12110 [Acidimicrobiales bacterium]|nr:hypothetical protein [Acidimicrobiales bacterium]
MATKRYRITLTVEVEDDHVAYDDPEWIADAAWGALSNEYGLVCTYDRFESLPSKID